MDIDSLRIAALLALVMVSFFAIKGWREDQFATFGEKALKSFEYAVIWPICVIGVGLVAVGIIRLVYFILTGQ